MEIKGPIRAILYVHKVIQAELDRLASLASGLELGADFDGFGKRVNFLSDFVDIHVKGEDNVFYPAADGLRKDISKAYSWDHRLDEKYFQTIKEGINKLKGVGSKGDLDTLRRNIYDLRATLSAHAQKEDDLLVPLIDQEMPPPKQGEMFGKLMADLPMHKIEEMFKWIISTLSMEERADYLGIIKKGAPPEQFAVMMGWVKGGLSENEWKELLSRMA